MVPHAWEWRCIMERLHRHVSASRDASAQITPGASIDPGAYVSNFLFGRRTVVINDLLGDLGAIGIRVCVPISEAAVCPLGPGIALDRWE